MELTDLVTYGVGILLSAMGFILKNLWTDIRENKENMGKLKGRIELSNQKLDQTTDKIQHISSLKFKQLNEKLDTMCLDIKEDIQCLTKEIHKFKDR